MADETLPPELLPRCPGGEVFISTDAGLFRVVPNEKGDDWEIQPARTN